MKDKDEVITETEEVRQEGVGLKDLSTGQKVVGAGLLSAAAFGIYSGVKAVGNIKIGKDKKTLASKISNFGKTIKEKLPKVKATKESNDQESE